MKYIFSILICVVLMLTSNVSFATDVTKQDADDELINSDKMINHIDITSVGVIDIDYDVSNDAELDKLLFSPVNSINNLHSVNIDYGLVNYENKLINDDLLTVCLNSNLRRIFNEIYLQKKYIYNKYRKFLIKKYKIFKNNRIFVK